MRIVESAFLVIGMLATAAAAQLTVIPTARDVTPVKSTLNLRLSPGKADAAVRKAASALKARVDKSPRGNLVVVFQQPTSRLDDYCIYPIINAKTGRPHAHVCLVATDGSAGFIADFGAHVGQHPR